MKKFTNAFFLSAAAFAIGFATLIPLTTEANAGGGSYYPNNQGDGDQGYDDQGGNNQDYSDQGGNNQGYSDQGGDDQEAPSGPSLNVSVEPNLRGEYGQMFKREQDKYEIFLRALDNPNNSTKGSKPARVSIDGGDAKFEGMKGDPKGVLVAIAKKGNTFQHFCQLGEAKQGVIKGFPEQITVVLHNTSKTPYATKGSNTQPKKLLNDVYPECEVKLGQDNSN